MPERDPESVVGFRWSKHKYDDGTEGVVAEIEDSKNTSFPVFIMVLPDPEGGFLGVMVERATNNYDWSHFDSQTEAMRETEMYTLDWLANKGFFGFDPLFVALNFPND